MPNDLEPLPVPVPIDPDADAAIDAKLRDVTVGVLIRYLLRRTLRWRAGDVPNMHTDIVDSQAHIAVLALHVAWSAWGDSPAPTTLAFEHLRRAVAQHILLYPNSP